MLLLLVLMQFVDDMIVGDCHSAFIGHHCSECVYMAICMHVHGDDWREVGRRGEIGRGELRCVVPIVIATHCTASLTSANTGTRRRLAMSTRYVRPRLKSYQGSECVCKYCLCLIAETT